MKYRTIGLMNVLVGYTIAFFYVIIRDNWIPICFVHMIIGWDLLNKKEK